MKLECPKCKKVLVITEKLIQKAIERGKNKGRCPGCNAFFIIPLPAKALDDDVPAKPDDDVEMPTFEEKRDTRPPEIEQVSADEEPSSFITAGFEGGEFDGLKDIDISEIAAMEDAAASPNDEEEAFPVSGPGVQDPISGPVSSGGASLEGGGWHTVDAGALGGPGVDPKTGEKIESTLAMGGDAYAVEGEKDGPIKKKLVVSTVTVICLAILALIIVSLTGSQIKAGRAEDHGAYEKAMRANSLALTRAYVSEYPDGLHIEDAKVALADHEAYDRALRASSPEELDRYLSLYPAGLHADEAAYRAAALRNTVRALQRYVTNRSGGAFVAAARAQIAKLEAARLGAEARQQAIGGGLAAEAAGKSPLEIIQAYQACMRVEIPERYMKEATARVIALTDSADTSWQATLRTQVLAELGKPRPSRFAQAVLTRASACGNALPLPEPLQRPLGDTLLIVQAQEDFDVRPLILRHGRAPVTEMQAMELGVSRWASKLELVCTRETIASKSYTVSLSGGQTAQITVPQQKVRCNLTVSRGGKPYIRKFFAEEDPKLPPSVGYRPTPGETGVDTSRLIGYSPTAERAARAKMEALLRTGDLPLLKGPLAPLPRTDKLQADQIGFLDACARAAFSNRPVTPREFARAYPASPLLIDLMKINVNVPLRGL